MTRSTRRVLLVGWDSADWRLLRPLMDAGALPHLSRLVASGVQGNLRTLQPQFSPLLWTSLATGQRANKHRVLHALVSDSTGGIKPLSQHDRNCQALWDILSQADYRSVTVNWPVTYPAEPISGVCISDLFCRLAGSAESLEPVAPGATYPASLSDSLVDLRFAPSELTREEMAFFVTDVEDALSEEDPLLGQISIAVAETITTHALAQEQLTQADWQLAMVRYEALDILGPRIMACLPPQLPYVPDKAFARYQGTVGAMCRYLDLMLGTLLDVAGPDTTVILVSQRGVHSDHLRPQDPEVAFRHGGSPWYREQGILAMAGPDLCKSGAVQGADLLDIAPTVLQLLNLPVGSDMPGRVLKEAFSCAPECREITSHEPVAANSRVNQPPTPEQQSAALARWRELSYLDDADIHTEECIANARRQHDFNLAMVEIEAKRSRRALELLERLHLDSPEDDRVALHLARCRRRTGNLRGARDLLERVVAHPDQRPYEQMQLAQLHRALGEPDKALMSLFRAEQVKGDRPAVHSQIGEVYLSMERFDEAERAFGKALERDEDHAESHRGMAATRVGQERFEEAIDSALRAIELDRRKPSAHYYLGCALAADNQIEIAIQVFHTCLQLDSDHPGAHRELAAAYRRQGDTDSAAGHQQRFRQLESLAAVQSQMHSLKR